MIPELAQSNMIRKTDFPCVLQEIGVSDEHASAIIGAVESTRDAVLGRISDEQ